MLPGPAQSYSPTLSRLEQKTNRQAVLTLCYYKTICIRTRGRQSTETIFITGLRGNLLLDWIWRRAAVPVLLTIQGGKKKFNIWEHCFILGYNEINYCLKRFFVAALSS